MLNNIVLSGGTTMMPGFSNRINLQLKDALNRENISYSSYKVIAEGNRNISSWIGASMISSMSSFNNVFITREEYNENGENKLNIFQKIF
jgi:actin-related protein